MMKADLEAVSCWGVQGHKSRAKFLTHNEWEIINGEE